MTYLVISAYPRNRLILASRLGEHGILDSGTKITFYPVGDDLFFFQYGR